jgi:hypothetical protein
MQNYNVYDKKVSLNKLRSTAMHWYKTSESLPFKYFEKTTNAIISNGFNSYIRNLGTKKGKMYKTKKFTDKKFTDKAHLIPGRKKLKKLKGIKKWKTASDFYKKSD